MEQFRKREVGIEFRLEYRYFLSESSSLHRHILRPFIASHFSTVNLSSFSIAYETNQSLCPSSQLSIEASFFAELKLKNNQRKIVRILIKTIIFFHETKIDTKIFNRFKKNRKIFNLNLKRRKE
ncbi:hypothetical protein BpHYR1_045219 [Brachionus plicatilis]|uniref:Uncharacterized protein n=1 Tax=Brachionus plicatilis TaxID=10195 RepID=A0A3M7P2R9_BRAPC|nr:hypothetical protein BpHYR1_045219 [Brachionus plicatilis]